MLFIPYRDQQVNLIPLAVWPYFDKVAVWLKQPIDRATIAKLRAERDLYVGNDRARFDRTYRQRLEFKQPSDVALAWIGRQSGLINSVEVTSDMIFATRQQVEEAQEFLNYHLCRRWHGRQHVHFHYETRYDASPWARNRIVLYPERHSRITGECNVLHLEWRAIGVDAVRRAGISSCQDLLNFDHRKFWEKRLLLLDTTPERIGRYLRNHRQGTKSQMFNRLDERHGTMVLDSVTSMQELIDKYGRCFDIRRVMTELSSEPFLPTS